MTESHILGASDRAVRGALLTKWSVCMWYRICRYMRADWSCGRWKLPDCCTSDGSKASPSALSGLGRTMLCFQLFTSLFPRLDPAIIRNRETVTENIPGARTGWAMTPSTGDESTCVDPGESSPWNSFPWSCLWWNPLHVSLSRVSPILITPNFGLKARYAASSSPSSLLDSSATTCWGVPQSWISHCAYIVLISSKGAPHPKI
jgi:hypothetical protein